MSDRVTVTAPQVVVTVKGNKVRHNYAGDILGDDVLPESVKHLEGLGFVTIEPEAKPGK